MSQSTPETAHDQQPPSAPPGHGGGHGGDGDGEHSGPEHDPSHDHHPFLAHHFDTPTQQFEAGKLGIWLFLVTEVLFFAGLFCAYTVYRAQHPEVFVYAHYHLDTTWGAVNTCVLLFSSLTAAWAVRCAQMADKRGLVINIVITLLCAFAFLGVKYMEYSHKVHEGTLWGHHFNPEHEIWQLESFKHKHPESAELADRLATIAGVKTGEHAAHGENAGHGAAAPAAAEPAPAAAPAQGANAVEQFRHELASASPEVVEPLIAAGLIPKDPMTATTIHRPYDAQVFFSIYFFMTGLHGFHVLGGIVVFIWMLTKALKGQFGPNYFGPIDFSALYWHLVDLIWIYLFPLLYLIH
jgi:cytochrome c oxidase subunit 3